MVTKCLSSHINTNILLDTKSIISHYLKLSKTIHQLKQTQAFLLKTLTEPQYYHLLIQLLQLPGNNLCYARQLFEQIPYCRNQFLWTSLIRSHVVHAQFSQSIILYVKMQRAGVSPSGFTISSVLSACARIPVAFEGKQVHAIAVKSGFLENKIVLTALLDMYAKCGFLLEAESVFNRMNEKDVVSWTAMICAYTKVGMMGKAQRLFDNMEERNVFSWTAIVAGYAHFGNMRAAKELYDMMLEKNSITWVAMIAGFGKIGEASEARRVFDDIAKPDASCWAAMVACYAQNGYAGEAIEMYEAMRNENVRISAVAIVGAISACTQRGDTEMVQKLVKDMEKECCNRTVFVSNALIHMHAKCGCMDWAWMEFNTMKERDAISFSTMISALADHGDSREALYLFWKMQQEGIKPSQVTFISVLNACSRGGLIEDGCQLFELMTQTFGIEPSSEHLTCMVDLLGKAGQLEKAYGLIMEYRATSNAGTWGALLGACQVHGNAKLGEMAARYLFEIEPENAGNYVLLANTYASVNKWEDAERVRKMIIGRGNRKSPGCSWLSSIEK